MTLARYLFSRLCLYFLILNGTFSLLYNIVEFFEKIVRVQHATFKAVITFVGLNVFPTFFDLVPLGSFIAAFLLVREIHERGEWDTIFLMGIQPRRIVKTLALGGLLLSGISFVGKEIVILPLTQKAEKLRLREFKGDIDKKIYDQWFAHDNNIFTHFSFLDLKANHGENLSILYLSPTFEYKKTITAPVFSLDASSHSLLFAHGTKISTQKSETLNLVNTSIKLPDFFAYLTMNTSTLSLKDHLSNLIVARSLSSKYPFNQEVGGFLNRMLRHLQPFLYVTLIFCLFFLFSHMPYIRWIIIALPYPFFVISTNFCTFLIHHNASALVVTIPYLLAFLCIFLCMRTSFFRKNVTMLAIEKAV